MKVVKKICKYYHDPLYKNSFYIMLTSISSSGFGFLFWVIAARLYSQEDVGISTALIASINLIVLLSRFGFDQYIIRFFPEKDKSKIFSNSIIITTIFSVIIGLIFILGIEIWSPELIFIKNHIFLYLLFLIVSSLISLLGISFVALRKSMFYFIQSLIIGSRVILLFPLLFLGSLGIFSSFGISSTIALIFSFIVVFIFGIRLKRIDKKYLKESFNFSAGNYISGLLVVAPNMILPILVLNVLGPEKSANYYIVFAIVNILFMISYAFSTSLFVEGSHGNKSTKNIFKSVFASFIILTIAIFFLYFFGDILLRLIGDNYVQGFDLLKIMALSSFFVTICQIYFAIKKVQKDMKGLISISLLIFILLLGLSYIFMIYFDIIGVGYAWIISYGISSLLIIIFYKKINVKVKH